MTRIAILDDYQGVALEMADWSAVAPRAGIEVIEKHLAPEGLAARLAGVGIVVAMRERTVFDAAMLERLPDLRLLITTGMVNRSIDMGAARARGVTVCGTPGGGPAAAELAFGLVLSLARDIPRESARFRAGEPQWQATLGSDLGGATLGLVGFGRLGKEMARYGAAFRMEVLAWSRSLTEAQAAEHGVERTETLEDLLARSDVVSIHLPLSDATRGLIGRAALKRMKPSALLVNTSRGPIIDEPALIAALRNRAIRGAGLDVFDTEPLPQHHPLRTLPNVVATPHLGYVTEQTYRRYFSGAVEAITGWLDGAPVRVLNGGD